MPTPPVKEDAPIDGVLSQLAIPTEFNEYNDLTETAVIVKLEEWRRQAYACLRDFKTRLQEREKYSLQKQANIICSVAPLCKERAWTMEKSRELAKGTSM